MRKLLTLCLLLPAMCLSAQINVAVYVTARDYDLRIVFADKLVQAFTRSGEYTAVERTETFLQELRKEMSYQRTGLVDDQMISELGKQMGVEQVCIVDLIEVEDGIYAAARLIDAETAEIKKAESVSGRVSTMSQVTTTATKLANLLVAGKPVNQVEGTVVENKTPTQPAARDENEHQMLKDAFAQGYIQFENLEISLQAQCLSNPKDVKKAVSAASKYLGKKDWRYPTASEAEKIIDYITALYGRWQPWDATLREQMQKAGWCIRRDEAVAIKDGCVRAWDKKQGYIDGEVYEVKGGKTYVWVILVRP